MILHLVRHASAVERIEFTEDADDLRYLTPEGRIVARRFFTGISRTLSDTEVILTSPLIRAVQTSEIIAASVGFTGEIIPADALRNRATTANTLSLIGKFSSIGSVVIVGHEPKLSMLLNFICGNLESPESFAKCGTATIEYEVLHQRGRLISYVTPGDKGI